jgi:hypothetical protein
VSAARAAEHLQRLGFTELEAQVYLCLVAKGAASGYRVAQRIDKPVANVYKALQSLARKGAVSEDAKAHAAIDPTTFLARLESTYAARCRETMSALAALPRPDAQPMASRLYEVDQVMAQARTMIARAKSIVLVDGFPRPLDELAKDLGAAAKKRRVAVQAYRRFALRGATVVVAKDGERLLERWRGHWLNVVVDGEEALLAYLDEALESVHHALFVTSVPLALLFHNGFASEMRLRALLGDLKDENGRSRALSRARALADVLVDARGIPGAQVLLAAGRPAPTRKRRASAI